MAEYFRTKRARLGKVIPTTPDESDPESDPDSNSSATDEDSEMSDTAKWVMRMRHMIQS